MTMHIKPPAVRLVAPGGPVSNALRVMSAAHRTPVLAPEFDPERAEIHRLKETIRQQIERDFDRIDRCLVLLDAIDGDDDLNADFTTVEQREDGTLYTLGWSSDFEDTNDNGLADPEGQDEQGLSPLFCESELRGIAGGRFL